jgi:hypothetical protein
MKIPMNEIDAGKIIELQRVQYETRLQIKGWIGPQTTQQLKVSIGNLGHFICYWMTGSFTTLQIGTPPNSLIDRGINYLRAKMIDGTGQRELFEDYIPVDLWLSPGRVLPVPSLIPPPYTLPIPAGLGAPSNNLFVPIEFNYLFQSNSEIILDTKNDSDGPNYLDVCFHGMRVKTKAGGR